MHVTYDGPHDGVNVLALNQKVERGETVEVPDDLGAQLLDQGWLPGSGKAPTVAGILEAVGSDPVAAADALASEQAAEKPRKSLIDGLQAVIDTNPAEAESKKENV